jgi:hypothetical protein
MNRRLVAVFFLSVPFLGFTRVFGQEPTPTVVATPGDSPTADRMETPTFTPGETTRIPKPIFLKEAERLGDSEFVASPNAPRKGPDGNPWEVEADDHTPRGAAMANLEDPVFLNQINDWDKTETKPKVYYWHSFNGTNYCHFRDRSGNPWYGWAEGPAFRWALYRSGHFWWHDDYAERSLYFDRGYWWWQGPVKDQYQVYLEDGHYHVCGADGVLGEDLYTTGTEEVTTQPVEKEVTPLAKPDDGAGAGTGTGMGTGFGH